MKKITFIAVLLASTGQLALGHRVTFNLSAPLEHAFVYAKMWNGHDYGWTLFPEPVGTVPAGVSSFELGNYVVQCWAVIAASGPSGAATGINSSINPPDGLPFQIVFPGYNLANIRTDIVHLYQNGAYFVPEAFRLEEYVLTNEDTLKTDREVDQLTIYAFDNALDIGSAVFSADATTETLPPTSQTVNLGRVTGGNLGSLAGDDNNPETICKFIVPDLSAPMVRFTCTFRATKPSPISIELLMKVKAVTPGSYAVRGYMHDFANNTDQLVVSDSVLGLNYTVYSGVATGQSSNFMSAMNLLCKIEIQQSGPSTTVLPCANFEFVNVNVTG